jgi:hypothetical protein
VLLVQVWVRISDGLGSVHVHKPLVCFCHNVLQFLLEHFFEQLLEQLFDQFPPNFCAIGIMSGDMFVATVAVDYTIPEILCDGAREW